MKKIAFQSWKQAYQVSIGGGLVEASVPTMTAVLQKKRTGENTGGVKMIDAGVSLVFDMLSAVQKLNRPAVAAFFNLRLRFCEPPVFEFAVSRSTCHRLW
jgi:hypothetical protein